MKKTLLLLCLLIFSFGCYKPVNKLAKEITVTVKVTDNNNIPLENCFVQLLYQESGGFGHMVIDMMKTDEFGEFIIHISSVQSGDSYIVTVSKTGYYPEHRINIDLYKAKQHFDRVLTKK
jgi:hypothetical protein